MPDEQGGIVAFIADLVGTISDVGFEAIAAMLRGLKPETRKAAAWVLTSQAVGWARNAGPDGVPRFGAWLAGLPPAAQPIALEIVKELLEQMDGELERTRPNCTSPSVPPRG
jgi:hypothetical protein